MERPLLPPNPVRWCSAVAEAEAVLVSLGGWAVTGSRGGVFAGLDELGVTILACVTCLFASLFLLTGSLHSLPLVRVFHPTVTRTKRTSSCV